MSDAMTFTITSVESDYYENLQTIDAESTTGERLRLRMPSAVDPNEVGDPIELEFISEAGKR